MLVSVCSHAGFSIGRCGRSVPPIGIKNNRITLNIHRVVTEVFGSTRTDPCVSVIVIRIQIEEGRSVNKKERAGFTLPTIGRPTRLCGPRSTRSRFIRSIYFPHIHFFAYFQVCKCCSRSKILTEVLVGPNEAHLVIICGRIKCAP